MVFPAPLPYAEGAASRVEREQPGWPEAAADEQRDGPAAVRGRERLAAASKSAGANWAQRWPCQAPSRRSRTRPVRVPTGSSARSRRCRGRSRPRPSSQVTLSRPAHGERQHSPVVELAPGEEPTDEGPVRVGKGAAWVGLRARAGARRLHRRRETGGEEHEHADCERSHRPEYVTEPWWCHAGAV